MGFGTTAIRLQIGALRVELDVQPQAERMLRILFCKFLSGPFVRIAQGKRAGRCPKLWSSFRILHLRRQIVAALCDALAHLSMQSEALWPPARQNSSFSFANEVARNPGPSKVRCLHGRLQVEARNRQCSRRRHRQCAWQHYRNCNQHCEESWLLNFML